MAYMSQDGYDKLVAEVRRLESVERPKASAAIAEAADKGDLLYGTSADRLCLHAESITFRQPATGRTMTFTAKAAF